MYMYMYTYNKCMCVCDNIYGGLPVSTSTLLLIKCIGNYNQLSIGKHYIASHMFSNKYIHV